MNGSFSLNFEKILRESNFKVWLFSLTSTRLFNFFLCSIFRHVEQYKKEHRKAKKEVQKYLTNPLNIYLLIKRLTMDWKFNTTYINDKEYEGNISQIFGDDLNVELLIRFISSIQIWSSSYLIWVTSSLLKKI